jgi:tRNA(Arg) A34 adenosine deaminase TadA
MTAHDLIAHATMLAYRLAAYALQNMTEDAALLALMFC